MLSYYDYGVIIFYFAFMLSIGWIFRKFAGNTSDYFRGGGRMLWWMAGSSAFMVAFSAWTFTGGASKAYSDGTVILVIFFGNALGFFINYLWFAPKCRQMRVITPMEAVRKRFGKSNEQIFTWMQIPMGITTAAIWLYGLGVFLAAVFGFDLQITIIVVGLVVTFMTVTGGSWAVVASDFMQVLILMPVSIVAAYLALNLPGVGGIEGFMQKVPANHFDWDLVCNSNILYLWIFAVLIQKFFSTNNMLDSSRYLCVKDSKHAKKGAMLACILFLIGPMVWFIPPMAAAIVYPNLSTMFPDLGKKAGSAAYVAVCLASMPKGMVGLLVSGIFAATMSSMDSGLNRNAGIFVKNFYQSILRPDSSEEEQMKVSKIATLIFGVLVVITSAYFSQLKSIGLFDLMLQFAALVGLPYSIPLIWGMIIRKNQPWAAWTTIVIGFVMSLLIKTHLTKEVADGIAGFELTGREFNDAVFIVSVLCNAFIGSAWFVGSGYLFKDIKPKYAEQVKEFFDTTDTPVVSDDNDESDSDLSQHRTLGAMCMSYGGFILLLVFIPNSFEGRLAFIFCGGVIAGIGGLLWRKSKNGNGKAEAA